MSDLPRLSGAIRAFSGLSTDHVNRSQSGQTDLQLKRQRVSKKKTDCLTWEKLSAEIKRAADTSGSDIKAALKDLSQCARNIVGQEASLDTVESAAAFLFDIFKCVEIVGNKEAVKLRNIFGPYPASSATKACNIVRKIVSWLPEDGSLLLGNQDREEAEGAASVTEFGQGIKFAFPEVDWNDKYSSSESESEENDRRELDLKYSETKSAHASKTKPNITVETGDSSTANAGWLQSEVRKYFPSGDSALGMSAEDICSTIFDVLTSSKTDSELQNDLFELLGFERFELIEGLLQNRIKIIKGALAPEQQTKQPSSMRKKGDGANKPVYGCQVTIQSEQEKKLMKQLRRDEKRFDRKGRPLEDDGGNDFNPERMRAQREADLRAAAAAPLFSGRGPQVTRERYPNVYDAMEEARQSSAFVGGVKMYLPDSFHRTSNKLCEEVTIPHTEGNTIHVGDKRVPISALDEIGQMAFQGTKSLNRIQSVVFEAAYKTNENLLICAPTGAGKTNIAMLTILHELKQHLSQGVIKKDEFKIIYVAPMKALAAEMVRNFGGRLEPLGITVRELTGDMQLTKAEILKTQMLVTTPEKWDVVTRKSTGDVALAQLVKLLIIDEVHLLHDDRGSVIESLVARTLRQVESTQNMIRIVGLSATLPNYLDVARFLHVNPFLGLFFFDGRFRPVPLGQTFIGIKSTNKVQQLQDMNTVCYEKVLEQVRKGYQTMVFVHARNDTVRTATVLSELAKNGGDTGFFVPDNSVQYGEARKNIMKSRNRQLKELFVDGFSIHHAGMLRQDRNLVERYFSQGLIKCLVCTATLAWGVNLPAHAVIIKGTQIYDAKKGSFVDLGILDVMQIFGRAGRPQFDKFGHGTIITAHDKLSHYLSLMTRQNPIESQFVNSLTDNLNAEIALGTVTNVEEAVKWLSYTYLFVRMKCNPLVYGVNYSAVETDPQLEVHRRDLITEAGRKLDKAKMVRFEERTGYFSSTDMGRIASHFYIKYDTVEVINEHLKPIMTEADVFAVVSKSQEFDQIKVREDEMQELEGLLSDTCVMQVPGGVENNYGKINILLQAYVSRMSLESFSLISDQGYVAQNGGRIIRALFEICLKNSWPIMASRLLNLCKTVDKRLWGFENPLRQFPMLSTEILNKLEAKKLTVQKLKEMDSKEIGHMVHHVRMGSTVKKCVRKIPALDLEATIQPITRTVLRVRLIITPDFIWDDKVHGTSAESFWVWVEDPETNHIYHSELFLLHKKMVRMEDPQILVFTIPIFEPLPTQYYVKAVSDRWLGSEAMCAISFQHLILPERHPPHTELLDLQPLPITALNNPSLEMLYKYTHFNPIQTQIFHVMYHTDSNVLLGAPTGSGKTVAAEMAIFKVFRDYPKAKAVYIAPLKALVRERMDDWKVRIEQKLGRKVVELTGDVTPDMRAVANADLIVTTPEKWDGVSRSWQTRNYVKAVALLVIDEIHLLGDERGPVLEVIVSRTNFISSHTAKPVRVVGLSTALANARDLADWLGIKQMGLYNFRPSVRPVPLEVHIHGFPGQHYCPRMATMNKPTFQAVKTHSSEKPVLVFVSSRRQTRLTALDLIAFLAAEEDPKQWLHNPEMELRSLLRFGRRMMGRRVPYRLYFMCLCGLYLLIVFVFHGRLQLDIAKSKIASSSQNSQNTGTKMAGSVDKNNGGSSGSKNSIVRQIRSVKSRQTEKVLESPISKANLCLLKATTKAYQYVNVHADIFYVYSAYLDERYFNAFVRVLALIIKGKKNKVNVKCHFFENGALKYVNNASIYEMCENHNKRYGGYILSCKIPETRPRPCRIGISIIDTEFRNSPESKTVVLNITSTSPSMAKYDYGVCIPPLFGDVRRENIVEFIELTKLLGAQHFLFYDFNISNSGTNQVLDYYTKEGTVTVIPWKLPENIEDRNIWYHGQLLAHNDCLNRAMSLMKVVSINDIDEFIIPHDNNFTWHSALSYLMQNNVVGLSFNSAFYDPVVGTKHSSGLLTVGNTGRSKLFSRVRTKVMLQPFKIFEVGIHHVSKPAQEGLIIKKVDTNKAYLHHYRKCVSNYGMKCIEFEQDNTIYRYYEQLKANYDKVLQSIDQVS